MQVDLTKITLAALELMFALATIYLVPYIKALVKEKFTAEQREKIRIWVRIAVQAAEMIYTESGMGPIKFEYVSNFLSEKGFVLDEDEIKALIESAVLELKNNIEE